jgi:hypothetical protein
VRWLAVESALQDEAKLRGGAQCFLPRVRAAILFFFVKSV